MEKGTCADHTVWSPGEEVSRGNGNPPAAPSCLFSKDKMKRSDEGKVRNIVKAHGDLT